MRKGRNKGKQFGSVTQDKENTEKLKNKMKAHI